MNTTAQEQSPLYAFYLSKHLDMPLHKNTQAPRSVARSTTISPCCEAGSHTHLRRVKCKKYVVMTGNDSGAIEAEVNEYMQFGWKPQGGVMMQILNGKYIFAQAMVMNDAIKNDPESGD